MVKTLRSYQSVCFRGAVAGGLAGVQWLELLFGPGPRIAVIATTNGTGICSIDGPLKPPREVDSDLN